MQRFSVADFDGFLCVPVLLVLVFYQIYWVYFHCSDTMLRIEKQKLFDERVALNKVLREVIELYKPDEASIEQVFLNSNPTSTIKLGMARGVVIMTPAQYGISVTEYEPNKVKKAVVGVGRAEKKQVETMVKILLPGCQPKNNDSADALAIALCHFQYRNAYGIKK